MALPFPVPTPYQAPDYGGNQYVSEGYTGQSMSQQDYPVQQLPDGSVRWSSGKVTGAGSVQTSNSGSVQGAQVYGPPKPDDITSQVSPNNQSSGGSGGGVSDSEIQMLGKMDGRNPTQESRYQELLRMEQERYQQSDQGRREAIEGGYNTYEQQLNSMLDQLPAQQASQEQMARGQYQQGMNTLTSQRDVGMRDLQSEQVQNTSRQKKTLRDIASDISNQMLAGSVLLGARGAGDSSAANMYSYALTKQGNKQRGDVMAQHTEIANQIKDKEFKLKTIYDTETRNLAEKRDNAIQQVAQWFYDQQNQIRNQKGQLGVNKAQDLSAIAQDALNRSTAMLQQITADYQNQSSMLQQWAIQQSDNIGQLKQNMQTISQYSPTYPQSSPIVGTPNITPQGNISVPGGYGYGGTTEDERRIM